MRIVPTEDGKFNVLDNEGKVVDTGELRISYFTPPGGSTMTSQVVFVADSQVKENILSGS